MTMRGHAVRSVSISLGISLLGAAPACAIETGDLVGCWAFGSDAKPQAGVDYESLCLSQMGTGKHVVTEDQRRYVHVDDVTWRLEPPGSLTLGDERCAAVLRDEGKTLVFSSCESFKGQWRRECVRLEPNGYDCAGAS